MVLGVGGSSPLAHPLETAGQRPGSDMSRGRSSFSVRFWGRDAGEHAPGRAPRRPLAGRQATARLIPRRGRLVALGRLSHRSNCSRVWHTSGSGARPGRPHLQAGDPLLHWRAPGGSPPPDPAIYGLAAPNVLPPCVLRGHGRIFPAPARGNPAPLGQFPKLTVRLSLASGGASGSRMDRGKPEQPPSVSG